MSNDNPLNDINVRVFGRDDPDAEKKTVQLYAEDNTKGVKLPFKTEVTDEFTANNVPALNTDDVGGIYFLSILTWDGDNDGTGGHQIYREYDMHGCKIYHDGGSWRIESSNQQIYELDAVGTFVPILSNSSTTGFFEIEPYPRGVGPIAYGVPIEDKDAVFQVLTPCLLQGSESAGCWYMALARRIA